MTFYLLLLSFFLNPDETQVTGQVLIDNDAAPGCEVRTEDKQFSTHTDQDGRFRLAVKGVDTVTLVFTYLDGWIFPLVIQGIPVKDGNIDLGEIPIVYNKIISVPEYDSLNANDKDKYMEIRHWPELLGYVNAESPDTLALRKTFWVDRGIRYKIDWTGRSTVIKYENWVRQR